MADKPVTDDPTLFHDAIARVTRQIHGMSLFETTAVLAFVFGLTTAGLPKDHQLELKETFAKSADKAIDMLEGLKIKSHIPKEEFDKHGGRTPEIEKLRQSVAQLFGLADPGGKVH